MPLSSHPLSLTSLRLEKYCTGLSICHRGLQPPTPPPAPPWLCPEHQPVSVKTLTALLPAPRASDPICTANSLPGLFCLSLPNTCYLNSKSFFWGLTVSQLFSKFTHYISNSATLFVCSWTHIYIHLHTHKCAFVHMHVQMQTHE